MIIENFAKPTLQSIKESNNPTDPPNLLGLSQINASKVKYCSSKTKRRCAFCIKSCLLSQMKLCGRCLKKPYCSENCQKKDWSVTGTGQRHVNWCHLYETCGEEDVEWEVVPVPNKEMGIRAKKLIQKGFRIIVDQVYTDPLDHSGIMELVPKGAPLEVKFKINSIAGYPARDGGKDYVTLRVSRVNHDCKPNAGYVYDEVARVEILFAQRDTLPGEEICICYCSFSNLNLERPTADLAPEEEFQFIHKTLSTTWGITCAKKCFCKDPEIRKLVLEGRKLNTEIEEFVSKGLIEEALESGEKMLDIQKCLHNSWVCLAGTELYLFQVALRKRKTFDKAIQYIRDVVDVYKTICPYSEYTQKCERMLNHPETDGNYLSLEKR